MHSVEAVGWNNERKKIKERYGAEEHIVSELSFLLVYPLGVSKYSRDLTYTPAVLGNLISY